MLGQTYSPSLKRIARETNLKSDNFYAETLSGPLAGGFIIPPPTIPLMWL